MSSPRFRQGRDETEIGNLILRALPRKECAQIFPSLEFVRFKPYQVLHETGEAIRSVYFLNEGLGSVLTTEPGGESIEVGLIGKDGFVGVPVVFGFKSSGVRVVTQAVGTAYRLDVSALRGILSQCPQLQEQLQRFSIFLAMQTAQIAACDILHDVVQRLARRLLMTHDRIIDKELPLTQEFLGHMLGCRRASVTVSAGILQKAGMIAYSRGSIRILNRKLLEETACQCYMLIEQQKKKWQAEIT
jgi:CRP-like cAMP-binding protein